MSSSKTLESTKSGVSPSQAIGDVPKRRSGLLKDNSWIKSNAAENEIVEVDSNYGRDVLGSLKTKKTYESKPAETNQTNLKSPSVTANSLQTSTSGTTKSSTTSTKSPAPVVVSKPPVPAKSPATTSTTKTFMDRVFSGANLSEKVTSPVKNSVTEQSPVSKEPPKVIANGENSTILTPVLSPKVAASPVETSAPQTPVLPAKVASSPVTTMSEIKSLVSASTTVTSISTSTLTSSEKTQPGIKTETSIKTVEQSNANATPKVSTTFTTTTTSSTTTIKSTKTSVKSSSNALDSLADELIPTMSPTAQTTPVSPKKSYSDTLSYSYSQTLNTRTPRTPVEVSVIQSPSQILRSPPVNPTLASSTSTRIVGKRDLCSYCGQSIVGGERMILDDLQIFSHTTCFKCEQCHRILGNLEAGDSLWVHRGMVNCASCYKKTKDQWFR